MSMGLDILFLVVSLQVAAADTIPSDTYRDPGVRSILALAAEARERDMEGILSYEGRVRERVYVGLSMTGFRRERGLFDGERVAIIRWERGGDRYVQWIGARYHVPLIGNSPDVQAELDEGTARNLRDEGTPAALEFDPWDDRMVFGSQWVLHPLSDSAAFHYHFSSGDTLRLGLPAQNRTLTMIEVRVEPRRPDPHLVAGSLWFDQESGSLVRASYKPARPFNLELDQPEDADDVPGFLKPITADIDYVTIEYSLHEFRYWLPRRFALEGEASLGRFLKIPLTVEWTVTGYQVNEEESEMPIVGPLPRGWTRTERRTERDGKARYVTILLPPADSIIHSAELSELSVEKAPTAFTQREIDQLKGELESLLPSRARPGPEWAYGLGQGMTRFNRVEGLSVGTATTRPLPNRFGLRAEARIGTADLEPRGEVDFFRGEPDRGWTITGYRRLAYVSDWEDPLDLRSSVQILINGEDQAAFYDALGGELTHASAGRSSERTLRLFFEEHRAVAKETDFHLQRVFDSNQFMEDNITAEEGTIYGGSLDLKGHRGVDPGALMLSGRIHVEGAAGDFDYWRWLGSGTIVHPLPFRLIGGLEGGLGMVAAGAPLQRGFYLGGPRTFRGLQDGDLSGTSFWFGRGEIGNEFPAVRLLGFGDFAWTGDSQTLGTDGFLASAGVGASLLDGILRIDLARVVKGGSETRLHLYFDGIF